MRAKDSAVLSFDASGDCAADVYAGAAESCVESQHAAGVVRFRQARGSELRVCMRRTFLFSTAVDDVRHSRLELPVRLVSRARFARLLLIVPPEMVPNHREEHPVSRQVDICAPALLLQVGKRARQSESATARAHENAGHLRTEMSHAAPLIVPSADLRRSVRTESPSSLRYWCSWNHACASVHTGGW